MEEEFFELVFEGLEDQSDKALQRLRGVLLADFELSVGDAMEIIAGGPQVIRKSEMVGELKPLLLKLKSCGAKAKIKAPPNSGKQSAGGPRSSEMSFEVAFDDDELLDAYEGEDEQADFMAPNVYALDLREPEPETLAVLNPVSHLLTEKGKPELEVQNENPLAHLIESQTNAAPVAEKKDEPPAAPAFSLASAADEKQDQSKVTPPLTANTTGVGSPPQSEVQIVFELESDPLVDGKTVADKQVPSSGSKPVQPAPKPDIGKKAPQFKEDSGEDQYALAIDEEENLNISGSYNRFSGAQKDGANLGAPDSNKDGLDSGDFSLSFEEEPEWQKNEKVEEKVAPKPKQQIEAAKPKAEVASNTPDTKTPAKKKVVYQNPVLEALAAQEIPDDPALDLNEEIEAQDSESSQTEEPLVDAQEKTDEGGDTTLAESPKKASSKKRLKFLKIIPWDLAIPIAIGICFLGVANWYYFGSSEEKSPAAGSLLDSLEEVAAPPNPIASPAATPRGIPKVVEFDDTFVDRKINGSVIFYGGVPGSVSLQIITPPPRARTSEEIAKGKPGDPWLRRLELSEVELKPLSKKRLTGTRLARAFIDYGGKQTRQVIDGLIYTEIDKVQKILKIRYEVKSAVYKNLPDTSLLLEPQPDGTVAFSIYGSIEIPIVPEVVEKKSPAKDKAKKAPKEEKPAAA